MEKYITLENDFYEILISESLKDYGEEVLKYSTNKLKEYLFFFKKENYGTKMRGSFFLTRYRIFLIELKSYLLKQILLVGHKDVFIVEKYKYYLILKMFMKDFVLLLMNRFTYYFKSLYMQKIIWIE